MKFSFFDRMKSYTGHGVGLDCLLQVYKCIFKVFCKIFYAISGFLFFPALILSSWRCSLLHFVIGSFCLANVSWCSYCFCRWSSPAFCWTCISRDVSSLSFNWLFYVFHIFILSRTGSHQLFVFSHLYHSGSTEKLTSLIKRNEYITIKTSSLIYIEGYFRNLTF